MRLVMKTAGIEHVAQLVPSLRLLTPGWPAASRPTQAYDCGKTSNNGDGIILLHGWPETSHMWVDLMKLLSDKGFRVVAPDQRGYSPQARPNNINEYKIEKIVQDVFSIADSFEFEQFHLIGHDWGASIGWASTYTKPERIITWTAMSVPHLSAFGQALQSDNDQKKKSRYISFFKSVSYTHLTLPTTPYV